MDFPRRCEGRQQAGAASRDLCRRPGRSRAQGSTAWAWVGRATQGPTGVEAQGVLLAENPSPGTHIPLSHKTEPGQDKVKRKMEAGWGGGGRRLAGPHTPAAPSPPSPSQGVCHSGGPRGLPSGFPSQEAGNGGGSPVSRVGPLPAWPLPLHPELGAGQTRLGAVRGADGRGPRWARDGGPNRLRDDEATLAPRGVGGDARLEREALSRYGERHGPSVLRVDKGQFPWKW